MINKEWDNILKEEYKKDYFKTMMIKLQEEYNNKTIYPEFDNIFNALKKVNYEDIKVVIIGQDPYHGEGEAHGLSFSVNKGIKIPPSLKNIYKELNSDLGYDIPEHGFLDSWTSEGVLLLNSILTVEKDKPLSHSKLGWEIFTDEIIKIINLKDNPVVFILWGNFAKGKKSLITNPKHLVIESVHPSPFSARNGFFGSKPFSRTNDYLIKNSIKPVNWEIK